MDLKISIILAIVFLIITILLMVVIPSKTKILYKKLYLLSLIIGFSLVLILPSASLGMDVYKEHQYEVKYKEVQDLMYDFDIKNVNKIEEHIDYLPSDYKHIKVIEDDFKLITSDINRIQQDNNYQNSLEIRDAYYNLKAMDEKYEQYDLSTYTEKDLDRETKLIDVRWSNNKDYFELYVLEGSLRLGTSLPDDRNQSQTYSFYTQEGWEVISYRNVEDSYDQFSAYRIERVTEESITIYCYADNETYTLDKDN